MKTLVIGGTGNVGAKVVQQLRERSVEVRVLARKQPEPNAVPDAVDVVLGDLLDPVAVEKAMRGVDKVFLLNAVVADELTQALIVYDLARRSGLSHITYLSVFRVEDFRDVPHFASKLAVEGAIRQFGLAFTILRPAYYMQNDANLKDALINGGIYPMPLGASGMAAVDIRDIAEAAATSLTQNGHEGQTYDLVGPTLISGPGNAELWSRLLARKIKYIGHDFDQWEQSMRQAMPAWSAFDMRMMFQGYFDRGFTSTSTQVDRVTRLLGHPPRSYEAFAEETAKTWKS